MTKPFANFNIFENCEFSKFRCHETACLFTYNCLVSPQRAVRSRQDQAITNWPWSILAVFEIKRFQESRTPENTENSSLTHDHSIRQLTLARYFSRCSHPTRHLKYQPRCREAMKFAPTKKIHEFWCPKPSPASIFPKKTNFRKLGNQDFRKSGLPKIDMFGFSHIRTSGNPKIHNFRFAALRKSGFPDMCTCHEKWIISISADQYL